MWAGAQCGGGNDAVFAIDANTFSIVAGPIGTGGVMGPIIANGANGRLYLLASGSSERVNPMTFAVTTNAFGSVMAIDPRTNILYANSGSSLQIINGAPDPEVIMSTIPLSYTPASAGINQELNHLYLANAAGRSIEVRNGLTGSLTATFSLLASGAIPDGYMSVDSIRGRIYITATKGSGRVLLVIEDLTTARNARSNRG
jgi:DNA-binding beta-propeller fold protein YncE